ncbi:MAG: chromate transporter [Actinomycetia bacterium]|nr:chromate transporter [Actinomycetes bacterium]
MIYLRLFASFFKIGLFSFGGGYGMIPLIERELVANGWFTAREFVQIISISEMTPGPIAVNTATLAGFSAAGIGGAVSATLGVVLPSFILIISTAHIIYRYRSHPVVKRLLWGVKPVVLALIIVAVVFVAENVWFAGALSFGNIEPASIIITVVSLALLLLLKVNPIYVLLASGAAGVALYYMGIF